MYVRVHVIYSARAEGDETPELQERAMRVLESLVGRFGALMREGAADAGIDMTLELAADRATPSDILDPRGP